MGIDIYARWAGQTDDQHKEQYRRWLSGEGGQFGYLREAYHGEPYATRFLVMEAFVSDGSAAIPAKTLRERLPHTLELVEERQRLVYGVVDKPAIEEAKDSFRAFVILCEEVEARTGQPVTIIASW